MIPVVVSSSVLAAKFPRVTTTLGSTSRICVSSQGRRGPGPSPLEAMEGDFRALAELLAAQAPAEAADDRPTEQLGLF